jgi:hypothetical protein
VYVPGVTEVAAKGGAASERMKVLAEPFTPTPDIEADGLAPVAPLGAVPFAAAVIRPLESTVMLELVYDPAPTPVVERAGTASERINVEAEPFITEPDIVAVGLAPTAPVGKAPFVAEISLPN